MNEQHFIIVFSLLLIKGNGGRDCSKLDTKVSHCPSSAGWFHQHITSSCILKRMSWSSSWDGAKNYCETTLKRNGTLATAIPYKELDQLKFLNALVPGKQHWVGLSDIDQEGEYIYTNGYKIGVSYWNTGEPNGGTTQNCVMFSSIQHLADAGCKSDRPYICQTESQIGPRELKLEMNWHDAGKKVFYKGFNASVTCSVFSPLYDQIVWTVQKGNTRVDLSKIKSTTTIKNNLEINELGKCSKRTYSTFSFAMDDTSTGLGLACYPRPTIQDELCPKNNNRLTYCKQGEKIGISGAVRGPPTISLVYPGMPGPATFNTMITMKCVVRTDGTQQSIFLINCATGPEKPKPSYLHRSVKNTTNGKIDTLTLKLPFKQKYAKASFSCFVNDVLAAKMNTKCHSDNPLCAESTIISTSTKGAKKGPRNTHLNVQFHVKPNYVYEEAALHASCSALDAYNSALKWKAFKSKREIDLSPNVLLSTTTDTSVPKASGSGEVTKTKLQLSIYASSRMNGTKLSCYSDAFPHTGPCEYKQSKYKYCDATDMGIVIISNKPVRPDLTLSSPGYPLAMRSGTNLTANCTVSSKSDVFTLTWIIFGFGRHGTVIVGKNASILKSYKRTSKPNAPLFSSKHFISSSLVIPLGTSVDGMSIGCAAYDIDKDDNLDEACILSDNLCRKSHAVRVLPGVFKGKRSWTNSVKLIAIAIGVLMLILFAAFILYLCYTRISEGEDLYYVRNDYGITSKTTSANSSSISKNDSGKTKSTKSTAPSTKSDSGSRLPARSSIESERQSKDSSAVDSRSTTRSTKSLSRSTYRTSTRVSSIV